MLGEDSEAAANRADECKGCGVREVLWLGWCSGVNYLFRRSFRESLAVWCSGGGLACFEHECVDTLSPRFARKI